MWRMISSWEWATECDCRNGLASSIERTLTVLVHRFLGRFGVHRGTLGWIEILTMLLRPSWGGPPIVVGALMQDALAL
jgi:hypothetical protein